MRLYGLKCVLMPAGSNLAHDVAQMRTAKAQRCKQKKIGRTTAACPWTARGSCPSTWLTHTRSPPTQAASTSLARSERTFVASKSSCLVLLKDASFLEIQLCLCPCACLLSWLLYRCCTFQCTLHAKQADNSMHISRSTSRQDC